MKTRPTICERRFLYFQASRLHAIGEACFSLTPKVSVFPGEVFLEIGCTEKAFGGETKILWNVHRLIEAFQVKPVLVVTDRPEWARAFACAKEVIIPRGKSQEQLLALPIERLPYCGDPSLSQDEEKERTYLTLFMQRVGIKTIADFSRLSTVAIHRRFGKRGVLLHEWVLGKREVVLPLFSPEEKIVETVDTEEVTAMDALIRLLELPLLRLSARLQGRQLVAKSLLLSFALESRQTLIQKLTLTEPKQDAASLHRLLKECLASVHWNAPLQTLTLQVLESEPYQMGQLSLWSDAETKRSDLAEYVGRLRARFGEECVGFPQIFPSYLPESSWKNVWPPEQEEIPYPIPGRPPFLFSPPRPWSFSPQWNLFPSETVATEWWEGKGVRNYFIAESQAGELLWVFFHTEKREWFLHGTFD